MQDEVKVSQAADLLTKAIGDISAALTMAGKADKITEWTAPYVAAVNAMDDQAERDTLAQLREAVQNIERICRENVRETDEPDRVKWDGVWHEGPLATAYIQTLQAFGELARQALATRQPTPTEGSSHDQ